MKKDMYDSAVHELIENGFLVLGRKNTFYDFYEKPLRGSIPKKDNKSTEKQENTTRNNTIDETGCGLNSPFQGGSSLPKKQTSSASVDAAGNELPARDKPIPRIHAKNLYELELTHQCYVKYLGDNVVQFPSGKKFKVIEQEFKVGLAPVAMFAFCDDLFRASGLQFPCLPVQVLTMGFIEGASRITIRAKI